MLEEIRTLLGDVLQLGERTHTLNADSPLMGSLPELDSMAVVGVITAIEENYDFIVDFDEVSAETFSTLGTLTAFVEQKISE